MASSPLADGSTASASAADGEGIERAAGVEDQSAEDWAVEDWAVETEDGDLEVPGLSPMPDGFHFVVDLGEPYLVLEPTVDPAVAIGAIELQMPADEDILPTIARRAADPSRLTDAQREVEGAVYSLHDASGPRCTASLGSAEVVMRMEPPYELMAAHRGEDGYERRSETSLAEEVWELGAPDALLAARLVPLEGSCEGSLWAGPVGASPVLFVRVPTARLPADAPARALAAFRSLPAYRALQRQYESDLEIVGDDSTPSARWESFEGGAPAIAAFQHAGDEKLLISVSSVVGADCGYFGGSLWAVYEVGPGAELREVAQGIDDRPPRALFDLEGDGQLETLMLDRLSFRSEGRRHTVAIDLPFFHCPC